MDYLKSLQIGSPWPINCVVSFWSFFLLVWFCSNQYAKKKTHKTKSRVNASLRLKRTKQTITTKPRAVFCHPNPSDVIQNLLFFHVLGKVEKHSK
jgi:hypothetical protein